MDKFIIQLTDRYPALTDCQAGIICAYNSIVATMKTGGTLFICGNGGSAADSEHIAGELMKSFLLPRPLDESIRAKFKDMYGEEGGYLAEKLQKGLRAFALTGHCALSTAMANDVAADLVFAQQLMAFGKDGDVLLGISTSGNSTNVCHAVRTATAIGMKTIGLSGKSGGKLNDLCEIMIRVPEDETQFIQELHLPVYHTLCAAVEDYFFS